MDRQVTTTALLAIVATASCAPATPVRREGPPIERPVRDPAPDPAAGYVVRTDVPPEQAMAEAISRGLSEESALLAPDVDVRVAGGVAVLDGVVANERTRRRAGEIAQAVEGVKEVQNRLRVMPALAGDAAVAANVRAALAAEPALASSRVEVAVNLGLAVLRGSSPSAPLRALAEEIASAVAGVREVTNQIDVPAPVPRPSDDSLQSELRGRLAGIAGVEPGAVTPS